MVLAITDTHDTGGSNGRVKQDRLFGACFSPKIITKQINTLRFFRKTIRKRDPLTIYQKLRDNPLLHIIFEFIDSTLFQAQ